MSKKRNRMEVEVLFRADATTDTHRYEADRVTMQMFWEAPPAPDGSRMGYVKLKGGVDERKRPVLDAFYAGVYSVIRRPVGSAGTPTGGGDGTAEDNDR